MKRMHHAMISALDSKHSSPESCSGKQDKQRVNDHIIILHIVFALGEKTAKRD